MNIEISPKEYERRLNWYDGVLYCSMLNIDGKDDWRLPTTLELKYIYYSENDFDGGCCWSDEYGVNIAWAQGMTTGGTYSEVKSEIHTVRAVRSILRPSLTITNAMVIMVFRI